LTDLDIRIADAKAMCSSLGDQFDSATFPDLRVAVESMQQQINALTVRDTREEETSNQEGIKASASALNALVDGWFLFIPSICWTCADFYCIEMKIMRENTERDMAAELQAVKAARADALAAIALENQVRFAQGNDILSPTNMHQTPLNPSLKRKRSDDEGEDASLGGVNGGGGDANVSGPTPKAVPIVIPTRALDMARARKSKRARRVMSTIVQTASAITLGAVATWSALAFS
jgi:hypothetical protein